MSSASSPRQVARRLARSKKVVAASALALGGLASGYLHALRLAPSAYASMTCEASDETALAACLNGLVNGATTISLTDDIDLTTALPQVDLTTRAVDVTIDGGGLTISGGGTQPGLWFQLSADDTLQVTDLTMQDLRAPYGGAVYVKDAGVPVSGAFMVENSHFLGNVATTEGGAIYTYEGIAVTIANSTFDGQYSSSSGGAIYAQGDLVIEGSEFTGNDSGDDGGAVYSLGSVYVTDSYFADNYARSKAGAVYFRTDLTLVDSDFVGNASVLEGGVFYGQTPAVISISRSTFEGNSAEDGGVGYIASSPSTVLVSDSTFVSNYVYDPQSGVGGALYSAAPLDIVGSTFRDNTAHQGGAIYMQEDIEIRNSTFYANSTPSTQGSQGGALRVGASHRARIAFTTFAGNTTGNTAGGSTLWLNGNNTLDWSATVVSDSGPGPCKILPGNSSPYTTTDDTYVVATDSSNTCLLSGPGSDRSLTPGTLQMGAPADNGGLTDTMLPAGTSPLMSLAPSTNLGTGVTADQRGATRTPAFTIGAVQVPGTPAPGGSNAPVASPGDGRATVASPTSTAGGAPTSWVISAYSVDDTYLVHLDDTCAISAASGSCTVSGLTNGLPYKFTALPSNAQGRGRMSPLSNQVIPAYDPTPPAPPSVFPASAPRDVTGAPGDREVVVSWRPPESSGSFPVSAYKVTATPGGKVCLTESTSCTVEGLTNGVPYAFTVEALNGAGWGPASAASGPVTPRVDPEPAIVLVKGPRETEGRSDRITATGTTVGIPSGTELVPFIRYAGQKGFVQGTKPVTVQADGSLRWTRTVKAGRGVAAYVAYADVRSNVVFWVRLR